MAVERRIKRGEFFVWWEDARTGRLPMVCVGTGQPADRVQLFLDLSPPLTLLLLIVLLPLVLILGGIVGFGGSAGPVRLPVSNAWRRVLRRRTLIALAPLPVVVLCLVAAASWPSMAGGLLVLAVAAVVFAVGLAFWREALQPRRGARLRDDKQSPWYVRLWNVHPAFVAAYEAQGHGTE